MSEPQNTVPVSLRPTRSRLTEAPSQTAAPNELFDFTAKLTGSALIYQRLVTLGAIITLVAGLVGLFADQAGLVGYWMPYVSALMLLGFPALISEQRFWPRSLLIGFSALILVTFLSLLYAPVRSGFPPALNIEIGMFLAGSSASYLWRRFPKIVMSIFVLTGLTWLIRAVYSWMVPLAPSQERLMSPLGQWNASAAFYGALTLLTLGVALTTKRRSVIVLLGAVVGVLAGILWLTGSRGGLLVSALALGILLVLLGKTWSLKRLLTVGALAAIVGLMSIVVFNLIAPAPAKNGSVIIPSSQSIANSNTGLLGRTASAGGDFALRLKYWQSALKITADHPLLGVGPGSWQDVSWRYMTPYEDWSTATHNWVLQTFAEQGIFGGLSLMLLLAVLFVSIWRLRKRRDIRNYGFVLGAGAGAFLIGAHSLIDFDNRWPALMFLLAALAGVVLGSYPARARQELGRIVVAVPILLALVLQVGGVYFSAQFSGALGRPFGNNHDYNVTYDINAADQYLNAKMPDGTIGPLAGNALVAAESGMSFNPGDPRLVLMADLAQYYSLHMSAGQLYYYITHQQLSPWTEIYGLATTAYDRRRAYSYEVKVALAGIKLYNANPGWDSTMSSQESLYEEALRGLQNSSYCNAATIVPLVKTERKNLAGAPASTIAAENAYTAQILKVCPSFKPLLNE